MITQVPGLLPAWLKAQNQKWLAGGGPETGMGGVSHPAATLPKVAQAHNAALAAQKADGCACTAHEIRGGVEWGPDLKGIGEVEPPAHPSQASPPGWGAKKYSTGGYAQSVPGVYLNGKCVPRGLTPARDCCPPRRVSNANKFVLGAGVALVSVLLLRGILK